MVLIARSGQTELGLNVETLGWTGVRQSVFLNLKWHFNLKWQLISDVHPPTGSIIMGATRNLCVCMLNFEKLLIFFVDLTKMAVLYGLT